MIDWMSVVQSVWCLSIKCIAVISQAATDQLICVQYYKLEKGRAGMTNDLACLKVFSINCLAIRCILLLHGTYICHGALCRVSPKHLVNKWTNTNLILQLYGIELLHSITWTSNYNTYIYTKWLGNMSENPNLFWCKVTHYFLELNLEKLY